jgi:sterol desaturase/sphingolipid hydroxylase (fatty acid hydroxylase superfamily)
MSAYWLVFLTAFFSVAVWESFRPKRDLPWPTERRWRCNVVLLASSGALLAVVLRITPVALAGSVASSPYGILNKSWMPLGAGFAAALLLLDLTRYWVHRAFHSFYALWRIHESHHSDPDYDVSTAGRFHPLEVVFTQASYLAVIAVLAPPVAAVLVAELLGVVLNFVAHANASLPPSIERVLRRVFITPDLHRIHHSENVHEQSSNFGQTFSWWDRIFRTYLAAPAAGQYRLVTGVTGLQNESSLQIAVVLARPFQRRKQEQIDPAG